MCSGLSNEVISNIVSLSGNAVPFVCTSSRAKPASSDVSTIPGSAKSHSSEELIQQLFLSVWGIRPVVMGATAQSDKAFSCQTSAAPSQPVQTGLFSPSHYCHYSTLLGSRHWCCCSGIFVLKEAGDHWQYISQLLLHLRSRWAGASFIFVHFLSWVKASLGCKSC